MNWPRVITHEALLISLGLAFEVVFTALMEYPEKRDRRLMGYTYVWMIPIYALVYPGCALLYPLLGHRHFLMRGVVYMAIIYAVEYTSGWILRWTVGECPWEREYRGNKWAIHGLIRLDFAPAWIAAALMFEWTYRVLVGAV